MNTGLSQYGFGAKEPLGLGAKRKMSNTKSSFGRVSSQAVLRKPFELNQYSDQCSAINPVSISQTYYTNQIHKENQSKQSGFFIPPSFQKIDNRKSNVSQQKNVSHRNTPIPLNNNLVNVNGNKFTYSNSRQSVRSQGSPFSQLRFKYQPETVGINPPNTGEQKLQWIQLQYSQKLKQAAQQIQRLNNLMDKKDKENQLLKRKISSLQQQKISTTANNFHHQTQKQLVMRIETLIKQNTVINQQLSVSKSKILNLQNQLRFKYENKTSGNEFGIRLSSERSNDLMRSSQISRSIEQQVWYEVDNLRHKSSRKQSQVQLLESKLNSVQSQLNYLRTKYEGILVQIENLQIPVMQLFQ